MPTAAVTGATGFIGRHLVEALLQEGWSVRALARRPDPELARAGAELVPGALEDEASLERLAHGADALVHAAGAIQAPDRAAFLAANAAGAARAADAALRQGCRRLVHLSSLAARAPRISAYAESKALGEAEVLRRQGGMAVTVVRPPAVYGPGDRATLPIFRGLARGWLFAPRLPDARFSLLHARDLSALVVTLLRADLPTGSVLEPDDGRPGGYGWDDLARLAEGVVGRKVRVARLPRPVWGLAAGLAERHGRAVGRQPLLTRVKVAELHHPDWVGGTGTLARLKDWTPEVDFPRGLASTLAWYRQAGWL